MITIVLCVLFILALIWAEIDYRKHEQLHMLLLKDQCPPMPSRLWHPVPYRVEEITSFEHQQKMIECAKRIRLERELLDWCEEIIQKKAAHSLKQRQEAKKLLARAREETRKTIELLNGMPTWDPVDQVFVPMST